MARFVIGLVCGLAVGIAGTAAAVTVTGNDAHLVGWEVKKGGESLCKDPWVAVAVQLIDCQG